MHACQLQHTIMQDAATNCKCMRLASLPSNSVTAASLAHMRAHMASSIHGGCARFSTTFVNSPKPRDSVGLRWGPCEVPLALQLLKFSWKGGFFFFETLEGWIIKPLLWHYRFSRSLLLCGSFVQVIIIKPNGTGCNMQFRCSTQASCTVSLSDGCFDIIAPLWELFEFW